MPRSAQNRPLASYADKPPTAVQLHFANWIEEMTGYKVDLQSVALAKALHSEWQASPERQEMLDQRRKEREAALVRRQRGRPAKHTESENDEPEEEPEEAPAPRRRRAAPKAAQSRRAAAPEPDLDDDDDLGDTEDEPPQASALAGPSPRRRALPY